MCKRGRNMKKGLFITFEGPDGSGKTTVSKNVFNMLIENGYDAIYTREPGGIGISEQIRNVILDPKNTAMDKKTEALLYAASRRQHLIEKVFPALEAKQIIICDRFLDSSLAYQGYGRKIGVEDVLKINEFAIENCMPDKTIYLDIDAQTGLNRIEKRESKDRLDQESINFHLDVVAGYQEIIKENTDRIIVIDAKNDISNVTAKCYDEIVKIINAK